MSNQTTGPTAPAFFENAPRRPQIHWTNIFIACGCITMLLLSCCIITIIGATVFYNSNIYRTVFPNGQIGTQAVAQLKNTATATSKATTARTLPTTRFSSPTTPPTQTQLPTQTEYPTYTAMPTNTLMPTTTTMFVPSQRQTSNTPTTMPNSSCQETEFTEFSIEKNMDLGDQQLISIVFAKANALEFIAVIEAGYSLDFEFNGKIEGKYTQVYMDSEEAICIAKKLGSSYKLYVGVKNPGAEWSKSFPAGWKMSVWQYAKEKIEVDGANWNAKSVTKGVYKFGSSEYLFYCQLWDGKNSKTVFHTITEKGYYVTPNIPLQGTCWIISGYFDKTQLTKRLSQMTEEVIQRDHPTTVIRFYVGAEEPPTNWNSSIPDGWKITKP